ncbi:hypothetical protein K503DRAFT_774276, partial [Rhizopogon vinicolor AM-OR11-026]
MCSSAGDSVPNVKNLNFLTSQPLFHGLFRAISPIYIPGAQAQLHCQYHLVLLDDFNSTTSVSSASSRMTLNPDSTKSRVVVIKSSREPGEIRRCVH